MSEQLRQLNAWVIIWKFEYFNLWNVTISAFAKNHIIPKKNYGDYNNKRPDWLLIDRSNKKNPKVIAVIEYKDSKKFVTEKDQLEAIRQCNNYAQVLWAQFWVATDTNVSVWINPKWIKDENNYVDEKWYERSFEFIRDDEQQKLSSNFYFNLQQSPQSEIEKLSDEVKETYKIIERIIESDIGETKSDLKKDDTVDPTNLAKSVWQDIYVATGKEPTKCLYNVVELFIFKFLSDLEVLEKRYSFSYLIDMINDWEAAEAILKYYAEHIRQRIRDKFPSEFESHSWPDNTTIINWTIFVENWKAVLANAMLFKKSIEKYDKFGPLKNIDKSFKIRLYEEFLKRDSWVKWMWQFFTPRKVVGNIVEMAKVENLQEWSRVCDPFCGVWWFPLEVITERHNKDFVVKWNIINSKIKYFWYDKWNDSDAERTIILAKANMLIYLSELVKNNNTLTQEFARIFNETFKLQTWTLGTLADINENEEDKFDLIITNPPYVTSWSSILKDEIKSDGEKEKFYKINGMGVEWLALEWIIRKLKKWWKAFVVVPDWIFNRLNDHKLRQFILDECYINWIISLPINTFFTTPKKTYILAITKKDKKEDKQIKPVFTYLVTDIGETLDVYRFDTGKSDLEKAKNLFRMFEWNETCFMTDDTRCKIQDISKFKEEINNSWTVDRWWSKEEKIELGVAEQEEFVSTREFEEKIKEIKEKIEEMEEKIHKISQNINIKTTKKWRIKSFKLKDLVNIERWKSKYTQTYVQNNSWIYNLYSAKTTEGGLLGRINTYDYDSECLTYTTNGVKAWTLFYREKHKFSLNWDAAIIIFKNKELDYKYFYYNLYFKFKQYWFNRENKATPSKIYEIEIDIPIKENWNFDLEQQKEIANQYEKINKIQKNIVEELESFIDTKVEI